jgi:multiple sugar transport system permease protein
MSQQTEKANPAHYALITVIALMAIAPVYIMIMTSFKNQVDMFSQTPIWFFVPTLDNYSAVLFDKKFDRYLFNSLFVAILSTFLTLSLGGAAAYAIARRNFWGKSFISYGNLMIRMVPPAVIAVPVFTLWSRWGFNGRYEELWGLVLFYTALNLPFAIWLLFSFVKQIPEDLEEAAIVDGATPFQVFRLVIFPLMKSGYAVAAIFTFRIAWNEFLLALFLTGRNARTLPVAIQGFLTDEGVEWGRIMAMGTLVVIPSLIITFFAARQIITGLTAGAVKG